MLRISVPVAGPMPVSLQTELRDSVTVDTAGGLEVGDVDVDSFLKASDVCICTAEASFLRTMAGRKGRECPLVLCTC